MQSMKSHRVLFFLLLLGLTACQTVSSTPTHPSPHATAQLTPYRSPTALPSATPGAPPTLTPLPSPTPTPRTHTVRLGQDLYGIALMYGTTVEELRLLNPEINPNAMRVGTVLILPPAKGEPTQRPLAPTPIPLQNTPPHCQPDALGGLWCFWQLQNVTDQRVEAISARFQLQTGAENRTETVPLLLDGIPPQSALPVAAYFAAPIATPYQVSAELISAIPVNSEDTRHLPLQIEQVQISARSQDEKTAQVSCILTLSSTATTAASRVWLLIVAYDDTDTVIGLRRVEINEPLAPGTPIPYTVDIYATAPITNIQLFAEAIR